MGIYINMEMPKEGFVEILIRDDGVAQQTGQSYRIDGTDYYTPYIGETPIIYKAIPVPTHGRLGDLNELYEVVKKRTRNWAGGWSDIECVLTGNDIKNAPTIIPAEWGET